MNKLNSLENMGFRISWKLISIGLYGDGEIPIQLTHNDVLEYIDSLLMDFNEQTDTIITLICEKNSRVEFDDFLKKLANEDDSNTAIEKRKWRAYLLKTLLDTISKDCLQGMLALMEFWILMGKPDDCPFSFPIKSDSKSIQEYFSQSSYDFNVTKNREWLEREILFLNERDR